MRSGLALFLGLMLTFGASWLGLVVAPTAQLRALGPVPPAPGGEAYPRPLAGLTARGRAVFIANGCLDCHSQQVRPGGPEVRPRRFASDLARGWGARRSVPRDYLDDRPPLLGTMRTGPDLANIAARRSDPNWHHLHLYDPRAMVPGSTMPPYRYLYELRKIVGQPSHRALTLPPGWAIKAGYQLVPTEEATSLVAYLLALDQSTPLEEAGTR